MMRERLLVLWLGLLACSSDPLGDHAYFGTAGYLRDCDFATDSVGKNEPTPLGVSAADVLVWLEGERRLPVKYNPDGRKRLGLDPGSSEINLALTARGGAAWVDGGTPTPSDRDVYCYDNLILGAHLQLSTADGTLSHEMDLSFVLGSPDLAVTDALIPTTALRGAFREHPMPPEGFSSELWLSLHLEITPSGSSGWVTYNQPFPPLDGAVASFPGTLPCTRGYVPMAGAEYATSRALVVAGLNAPSPLALEAGAALELSFEDHAEQGCVLVRQDSGNRSLEFAAGAVMRSSDGAIDGPLEVLLDADFDGEALFAARATRSLYLMAAEEAAAQAADVITQPLDYSPYAAPQLHFLHRVTGAGDIEGSLRALGLSAQECAFGSPPESCTLTTELFAARWGNLRAP